MGLGFVRYDKQMRIRGDINYCAIETFYRRRVGQVRFRKQPSPAAIARRA
jgi:hypothetical protein